MKLLKFILLPLAICFFYSCVSIPKESVALSQELNAMIMSSRKAHLELLDDNTSLRIKQVEDFIQKEYTPDFIENFVETSGVLDSIQKAPTYKLKGMEILTFSQAAIPLIDERRTQMIEVVRGMDRIIRQNIDEHYREMLNVNQALTAHLASAAEVVEIRKELQQKLNISQDLIPMDKINQTMEDLIKAGGKAEKIPDLLENFRNSLNK